MKNASANICLENQNTILYLAFLPKIMLFLSDEVEKRGTARHATDDNIIPRMRIACWINKATYVYIQICNKYCLSTGKNGYANALLGYIYTYTSSLATSFLTDIPSVWE
jgi:hypothetical protein